MLYLGRLAARVEPLMTLALPEMPLLRHGNRHTAVNMGTDVDRPRNLAKSVTVE